MQLEQHLLKSVGLPTMLLLQVEVRHLQLIEPSHELGSLASRQIQLLLWLLLVMLSHGSVCCSVVDWLHGDAAEFGEVLPR